MNQKDRHLAHVVEEPSSCIHYSFLSILHASTLDLYRVSIMASLASSMHLLQTCSFPTTQFKYQGPFLTTHQPLAQYLMQTPIAVRYFMHMNFIFGTSIFIKISTVSIRSKHATQGVSFCMNLSSKTTLLHM